MKQEKVSYQAKHAEKSPKRVKRAADIWFKPRRCERDGEIYKRLGVRTFKKYMPTVGGTLVEKWSRKLFGKGNSNTWVNQGKNSLTDMERDTRIYETIHLGGLVYLGTESVEAFMQGQIARGFVSIGANILVDVYPIMLQRYNRARLYRAIDRIEKRRNPSRNQTA